MKNIINFVSEKVQLYKLQKDLNELCEKYHCKLLAPAQIKKTMQDLIGFENEKEVLQDALLFFEDLRDDKEEEDSPVNPNSRFLLLGTTGSGKAELVEAVAKTASVCLLTVHGELFKQLKKQSEIEKVINKIFNVANSFEGLVLNFDDFEIVTSIPECEQIALQIAIRLQACNSIVAFLSTTIGGNTSSNIVYPFSLMGDNLFNINKSIVILPPTVETRKALFIKFFEEFNVKIDGDYEIYADRLAKQTFSMYPGNLEYFVKETVLYARKHKRDVLTYKDFNEVQLTIFAGSGYLKMTEKEKLSTAYHEVGHLIAGYYGNTEYVIGRVEITPRVASLGLTLEEVNDEKFSMFSKEIKQQIIYLLGDMAAEETIYGDTSSGVSSDLERANSYAIRIVSEWGMNKEIGPFIYNLEESITSEHFRRIFEEKIQALLKELYDVTLKIMEDHKDVLEAIAPVLVKNEVLLGDEIKEIILKVEPDAEQHRGNYI